MSVSQSNNYVSIIVCHYGKVDDHGELRAQNVSSSRSKMLRETIASLVDNTDFPAELIIVDNGGNPEDSEYLMSLAKTKSINTYIRNGENMNFGWAWNQGAKLATGKWLCFTCNDLEFEPGWLSETIRPLIKYSEKKLIASPICTPDKDKEKFSRGTLDEYRLNALAGSNCILVDRKDYELIGPFSTHRIAGTHWHFKMKDMGYTVVLPPKNKAIHLGSEGGTNYNVPIEVKKTLLNDDIIDFSCKQ